MKKQKTQSKLVVALTAIVILLVALSATLTFAYFTASNSTTSSSMTFGTLNINNNGLVLSDGDDPTHATSDVANNAITEIVPGCTIDLAGSVNVTTNIDTLVRTQLVVTVKQYRDANGAAFTAVPGTGDNVSKNYVTGHADEAAYELAGTAGAYYLQTTTNAYAADPAGNKAQIIFNLINTEVATATANSGAWVDQGNWRYYNKVVNGKDANTGAATQVTVLNFGDNASITLAANEFGNDWQGAEIAVSFIAQAIQADHLVGPDGNDADENPDPITVTVAEGVITNIAEIAGALAWSANMATGIIA